MGMRLHYTRPSGRGHGTLEVFDDAGVRLLSRRAGLAGVPLEILRVRSYKYLGQSSGPSQLVLPFEGGQYDPNRHPNRHDVYYLTNDARHVGRRPGGILVVNATRHELLALGNALAPNVGRSGLTVSGILNP